MNQIVRHPQSRTQSFAGEMKPIAAAIGLAFGLGTMQVAGAATLTVTNSSDSGAGSLRDAVITAAAGDTIVFGSVTGTITLTTGEIVLNKDLTISGPGAGTLALSGNNASRIFNVDGTTAPAITISGLTLRNGNTPGVGGAITYDTGDGTLDLLNMAFTQNAATASGGAIWMECNACSISISDSTFTSNSTAGSYYGGGAISAENGAVLTITRSSFTGNTSATDGGAMHIDDVVLLIDSSTISGNTAVSGGGIYLYFDTPSTILNSTISGNTATSGNGGGIYSYNTGGSALAIQNSTIAGNTGSGVFLKTNALNDVVLQSTIVANNSLPDVDGNGFAPRISADHSLIRAPAAGTAITGAANILGQDPLLGALANNGGPTQTMLLQAGSPAIDTGSNPAALTFDQRGAGFPRTTGAATDMGAVEGAGAAPVVGLQPVPTLSQWGVALLSLLTGAWAMITGFGRRRRRR